MSNTACQRALAELAYIHNKNAKRSSDIKDRYIWRSGLIPIALVVGFQVFNIALENLSFGVEVNDCIDIQIFCDDELGLVWFMS